MSGCNDGPVVAGFGLESRAVEVAGFGHDVKAEVDFVVLDGDDFCAAQDGGDVQGEAVDVGVELFCGFDAIAVCAAVRVDGDAVARGDVFQALDVDGASVPVEADDAAGLSCVGICEKLP